MFVAMNNFRVVSGKEPDFEATWRSRKSYLDGVPGFVRFALLKGDQPGEYISHSTWTNREAFVAWTQSEAFLAGHRQGGSLMGVLEGPPAVKLYEGVLEEAASAATA
jgi:heme-degrading monooxygenase HmoA